MPQPCRVDKVILLKILKRFLYRYQKRGLCTQVRLSFYKRGGFRCVNTSRAEGYNRSVTKVHMTIATTNREQVQVPWLWRLGRDFDLKVNVLKANINEDFGWAFVELEGPVEEIQRATAWLHTTGLHIEPVERSVFE